MLKLLLILGLLSVLNNSSEAQIRRALCTESASIAFNVTQFKGVWWEIARSPAIANLACVKVNFTEIQPDNVLQIATTYAVSGIYLWNNETMYANVSLANSNSNGYNISYIDGTKTTKSTVYKLLNTDYTNYALFCGFTNASNTATSFGIILTRDRYPNLTEIIDLEDSASLLYSDFEFGTMPLVTQSPKCYTAGATTHYSVFPTLVAFLYSIHIFYSYSTS